MIQRPFTRLCPKAILTTCQRTISDEFTNKRITRLQSDIELESKDFRKTLINRNPLNLERLSFEQKPSGFWLDQDSPSYYNRLVLENQGRYLNAYLIHWSGKKILEASTREPQLSKYFNNPGTLQAAQVLAQVMARRCLKSGYNCINVPNKEKGESASSKSKKFFETVENCGLTLKELPEIAPRSRVDV